MVSDAKALLQTWGLFVCLKIDILRNVSLGQLPIFSWVILFLFAIKCTKFS